MKTLHLRKGGMNGKEFDEYLLGPNKPDWQDKRFKTENVTEGYLLLEKEYDVYYQDYADGKFDNTVVWVSQWDTYGSGKKSRKNIAPTLCRLKPDLNYRVRKLDLIPVSSKNNVVIAKTSDLGIMLFSTELEAIEWYNNQLIISMEKAQKSVDAIKQSYFKKFIADDKKKESVLDKFSDESNTVNLEDLIKDEFKTI